MRAPVAAFFASSGAHGREQLVHPATNSSKRTLLHTHARKHTHDLTAQACAPSAAAVAAAAAAAAAATLAARFIFALAALRAL